MSDGSKSILALAGYAGLLVGVYGLIRYGPALTALVAHHYAHASGKPVGRFVTWRRKTDGVLMTGWHCDLCGKVTCIEPSRVSYNRMISGEKY